MGRLVTYTQPDAPDPVLSDATVLTMAARVLEVTEALLKNDGLFPIEPTTCRRGSSASLAASRS